MCVALPGRVTGIEDGVATVDFHGNTVRARAGLVDVREGDRVLVHAGCIIQVLKESDAEEIEELFDIIEDIA